MTFKKEDENYIYELISKNIKKYRLEKGWTQERLANEINYSVSFIKGIESNQHQTFSLGALWRISRVLGIEFSQLCEEKENESNKKNDIINIKSNFIKYKCSKCNKEINIPIELVSFYKYILTSNSSRKKPILKCNEENCDGLLKPVDIID